MEEDSHHAGTEEHIWPPPPEVEPQRNTSGLLRQHQRNQLRRDQTQRTRLGSSAQTQRNQAGFLSSDPENHSGFLIPLGGAEGGLTWFDEDGDGVPLPTSHQGGDCHHIGPARGQLPEVKGRLASRQEVGVICPPCGEIQYIDRYYNNIYII